jgi:hypothetical protein
VLASGTLGALLAQVANHFLTRRREARKARIETFERLRREYDENEEIRLINRKEDLNDEEIERLLDFFELLGLYADDKWNLVEFELLDDIFGDDIIDCYEDAQIMGYVARLRAETKDATYYEYFEKLAGKLRAERNRKGQ